MIETWNRVIDSLRYAKPDGVDKEKLKKNLEIERTWGSVHIDYLYSFGILTIDEYTYFMKKLIEREKENVKWLEQYLSDAETSGDAYDPMAHYCLGSIFRV